MKAFAAEERETQRYDGAMRTYNKHMVDVSRSLALLNAGQDIIMALGLTGVAALTAMATFDGSVQPGDLAAVVLIMGNLYRPLSILGWAFREINQGAVDLEKLYGLLNMKAEVADAPDAKPLQVKGGAVQVRGCVLHPRCALGWAGACDVRRCRRERSWPSSGRRARASRRC